MNPVAAVVVAIADKAVDAENTESLTVASPDAA